MIVSVVRSHMCKIRNRCFCRQLEIQTAKCFRATTKNPTFIEYSNTSVLVYKKKVCISIFNKHTMVILFLFNYSFCCHQYNIKNIVQYLESLDEIYKFKLAVYTYLPIISKNFSLQK